MTNLTESMRGLLDSLNEMPKENQELNDILKSGGSLSDAWTDITVDGNNLLDMYMEWTDKGQRRLEQRDYDGQESYLGYDPQTNKFYSGWDVWSRSDSFDGAEHALFKLDITHGRMSGLLMHIGAGLFYSGPRDDEGEGYDRGQSGYNGMRSNGIIDIRLD